MESPRSPIAFMRTTMSPMKRPLFDDENDEPNFLKVRASPERTPVTVCKVTQRIEKFASPISAGTPSRLRFMTPVKNNLKGNFGDVSIFSTPDSEKKIAVKTVWVPRLKLKHKSAECPMGINPTLVEDLESEISALSLNLPECVPFLGAEFVPTEETMLQVNLFMEAGIPLEDVLKESDEQRRKELADEWISTMRKLNQSEMKVSDAKLANTLLKDGKICLCDVDFRVKPKISSEYETFEKALKYKRALWIAYQEIVQYGQWINRTDFMRNLREQSMELSEIDLDDF